MNALHKFLLFHFLTCLGQSTLGSEIINGEKAQENSMLYMASVQSSDGDHICGGFLISEDFVLTAAHCSDGECWPPAKVVLGSHNLKNASRTEIDIVRMCKHPSYSFEDISNDIMLLKLSRKVQLGKNIQTVPLPHCGMKIKTNTKCHATGWGMTGTCGKAVDDLRVVTVSVINPQVCKDEWSFLPPKVICAGGFRTDKGTCYGDSGGPLVCNERAVGIVSFGGSCDLPDKPDVFTDIRKFLPWIKKILKEKDCEM